MRINCHCPDPHCRGLIEVYFDDLLKSQVNCPICQRALSLHVAEFTSTQPVSRCICCAGDELYVRKDFPQRLGVWLVVAVAILSFYLFGRGQLAWALGVLVALVIVDLVIYRWVPTLTVCYRCKAAYHGLPLNPKHKGFDLATAEKFR